MTRAHRVRLGLLAIGALLGVLVTMQPGHSQPPIGPPGGGFRGVPPGFPTPPGPGMPGPGGFRGASGIAGRPPGFPEIPRPPDFGRPDFPRMPELPRPPGFGRRPGIGAPDIYEWTCSGCGFHLGTGPTPPLTRRCPGCGAILNGSEIVDGPGAGPRLPGIGGPPPRMTPPGAPAPFELPQLEAPPPMGAPAMVRPPEFDGGVYVPPEPAPTRSRSTTLKVIGITMGVLLLLGILIAVVSVAIIKQQPVQRSRRPRARRRYDDDDDF